MKRLFVILFTAAAGFAAVQNLPDGEGKAVVSSACSTCHGLDLITAKKAAKDEWQGIVDRMKGYGTTLDEKQTATVVDYLVKSFGAQAAAGGDAGKKLLESYCGSCHDLDLVSGRTGSKAEWQDIVDRMNGRGAGVPEKEVAPLVEYLVKTYGPPAKD